MRDVLNCPKRIFYVKIRRRSSASGSTARARAELIRPDKSTAATPSLQMLHTATMHTLFYKCKGFGLNLGRHQVYVVARHAISEQWETKRVLLA